MILLRRRLHLWALLVIITALVTSCAPSCKTEPPILATPSSPLSTHAPTVASLTPLPTATLMKTPEVARPFFYFLEGTQIVQAVLRDGDGLRIRTLPPQPILDVYGPSPSGHRLLFVVWYEPTRLYCANVTGAWQKTHIPADASVIGAAWSPLNDVFVYWTSDGALFRFDPTTPATNATRLASSVSAASWSPDGQTLALLRQDQERYETGLYLFDLGTGHESLLTAGVATEVGIHGYTAVWSDDSSHLLFLADADHEQPRLSIASVPSGAINTVSLQVDGLPVIPVTPLLLSGSGNVARLVYGTEELDGPDRVWVLDLDLKTPRLIDIRNLEGLRPLGWAEQGRYVVVSSSRGVALLDLSTLEMRLLNIVH